MEGRHEKSFKEGLAKMINDDVSNEEVAIAYAGNIALSLACIADSLEALAAESNAAADPFKTILEEFNKACEREKQSEVTT